MKMDEFHYRLHMFGNLLGLLIVCAILVFAFYEQLYGGILPCPLCYLQRIGYVAVGMVMCLNLNRGPRSFNYGLLILASLFLMFAAGRQTLLHIIPGDTGYGEPVLGKATYYWNTVIAYIIIAAAAIATLFQHGFLYPAHRFTGFAKTVVIIFVVIVLLNIFSAFAECGLDTCADNPTGYKYFFHKARATAERTAHHVASAAERTSHRVGSAVREDHRNRKIVRHEVVKREHHLGNSSSVVKPHLARKTQQHRTVVVHTREAN